MMPCFRTLLATLALSFVAASGPVMADGGKRPLAVVELFTSQGCNACPPADALLGELVAGGDVVALSYSVDYWDYLGWHDTLASPENTQRQNEYGKALGMRSVYTPQAIVNGRVHMNGAKRALVKQAISQLASAGKGLTVDLRATRKGDSLFIEIGAGTSSSRAGHLVLVYFRSAKSVPIERGENSGRTITYYNVVTDRQTAGMWHGKATRLEMPAVELAKKGGCAVLLQAVTREGLPGPILGATIITREDVAPVVRP